MLPNKCLTILLGVVILIFFGLILNYKINLNVQRFVDTDSEESNAYIDDEYRPDLNGYLLNPGDVFCGPEKGAKLLLASFNPSKMTNFDQRLAIRNTWSNKYFKINENIRNIFVVGLSLNQTINNQILLESQMYGDILQGDFIDTYKNLTHKTILGIKWMSEYCVNARFIMKIDDDMVVNTKSLSKYLNSLKDNKTMYGYCKSTWVQRDKNSKWYISTEDYAGDFYPKYCIGSAYIFTSDLMKAMYNLTQYIKPFIMEDVYVGMLAKELNATLNNIVQYWLYYPPYALYYSYTNTYNYHFVLVDSLEMFHSIWNFIAFRNFKVSW